MAGEAFFPKQAYKPDKGGVDQGNGDKCDIGRIVVVPQVVFPAIKSVGKKKASELGDKGKCVFAQELAELKQQGAPVSIAVFSEKINGERR